MRGNLARRFPIPNITKQTLVPSSGFSTSSGGGGRGRGCGSYISSQFDFTRAPGKTEPDVSKSESSAESPLFHPGVGHGRGKPASLPSTPFLPSFSSPQSTGRGRPVAPQSAGRGRVTTPPTESHPLQPESQGSGPKKPIFFIKDEISDPIPRREVGDPARNREDISLPGTILSAISAGAGRGKPAKQPVLDEKKKEENRHMRLRQPQPVRGRGPVEAGAQRMSRGGRSGGYSDGGGNVSGRGFRGRGGVGRGRGRSVQDWRGRGGRGDQRGKDMEDDFATGLYLGDNADGERLANKLGPENMNQLVEGFEENSSSVLPSPMKDEFLDALHTNFLMEFEPEYKMEEFGTNPDIDEKQPLPLKDVLEKMKSFIMQYEGIQSEEEWEEIMKELMETRVPLMKEIVDHYSGPNRVTAKKQQEELERVAKTLPESAPESVKQFANRAVLSLQSNPGWGFDKKCQFMDKVANEVSKVYK